MFSSPATNPTLARHEGEAKPEFVPPHAHLVPAGQRRPAASGARLSDPRLPAQVHPTACPDRSYATGLTHCSLACANGQKLKCLTVAEEFTREGLAIEVAGAIRSRHVIDALSRLVSERGAPMFIRSDNGPEFVSRAFAHNVVLDFSRPGKPTDNAFIESFNGRFRAECLNAHWFLTLDDARQKLEDWRRYDNEERPHGAIGQKAPITLINRADATNPAARVEVENSS